MQRRVRKSTTDAIKLFTSSYLRFRIEYIKNSRNNLQPQRDLYDFVKKIITFYRGSKSNVMVKFMD